MKRLIIFLTIFVLALRLVSAAEYRSIPHKMIFCHTGEAIKLKWEGYADRFELQGYHYEGYKSYDLPDLDGDTSDQLATISIQHSGHWRIDVRGCVSSNCTDWTTGLLPQETEPIGWFLYARPAPVQGGFIQ